MEEVKSMFSSLAPIYIRQLVLNIRNPGDFIPADLLGSSRVTLLVIITDASLDDPNTLSLIKIDPNAFRSSNQSLLTLEMSNFDHSRLNFNFLTDFGGISELRIKSSTNLDKSIPTLPAELPSLTQLHFTNTSGLKEAFQTAGNFESLKCNGLTFFNVEDSFIDTNSMGNLLEWILPSSNLTLVSLYFGKNEIESIPNQVSSFKGIQDLNIQYNRVDMTIGNNSIFIIYKLRDCYIQLVETRITSVESGAFQGNNIAYYTKLCCCKLICIRFTKGDYRACSLGLRSNSLTRFEEGVFKNVLQDLYDYQREFGDVDVRLSMRYKLI